MPTKEDPYEEVERLYSETKELLGISSVYHPHVPGYPRRILGLDYHLTHSPRETLDKIRSLRKRVKLLEGKVRKSTIRNLLQDMKGVSNLARGKPYGI